jgi:hypothetical protein
MALKKTSLGAVIAIAVTGLFLTVVSAGLITTSQTVASSGTITVVNVGVYSDLACTTPLTSIAWGSIAPGGLTTRTIYVKNTGTAQVTLGMTRANWNPGTANGPITLTWNQEGGVLAANQVSTATLTLSVSSGISGITNFSVDIVVSGTG